MVFEDTSLATIAASMSTPSSQPQAAKSDAPIVNDSLGKPSRKRHFKSLDALILFVSWICFVIAVVAITSRLNIAWTLRLQHQLEILGLMLGIMHSCLTSLAPKLWIIAEAWRSKPILQNLDAILQNSILTSNAYMAWRALLLLFIILPLALSLAYKSFIGGDSTRIYSNHTSWYGLTAAPGLTSYGTLKFGPSYMTNATLPFIMAWPNPATQFPQTYGFNHLVISNTSSASSTFHYLTKLRRFNRVYRTISPAALRSPQMCTQQSPLTINPSRRVGTMTLSGISISTR